MCRDRNSGDWFYGAPESGWPSLDSTSQCYYMLGTTAKLSMPFHVWNFLCLGLTVTEINIKKVQKQDLKNIKYVKGCRDGRPKSMQTR